MKFRSLISTIGILILCIGCNSPSSKPSGEKDQSNDAQPDAHAGHNHGDIGPNGGHLLHLEPSGLHAEWTHDDETHLLTVFLDDFDAGSIVEAKFEAKIGDEVENYPLEAGNQGWSVTSQQLMTHINMGDLAEVQLVVVDGSGRQTAKIEAHEHHHH